MTARIQFDAEFDSDQALQCVMEGVCVMMMMTTMNSL